MLPHRWKAVGLAAATFALGCGDEAAQVASRPANPTCLAPARAVPAGLDGLAARLADTGCFEGDPPRPTAGLIPYVVNAPLWSDGADKLRWLALPDGAQMTIAADGDLTLPPGSVLIKTFLVGGRPIETRFFARHGDGVWSGYDYAWNEQGTDATLLDEGSHDRTIRDGTAGSAGTPGDGMPGTTTWHFPSRAECDKCHTSAAGYSLGLELAQLSGGASQLATWEQQGLFAVPLPAVADRPMPLPAPNDPGATVQMRARSYLHTNCANCHRPGVGNAGTTDLRFTTTLADTASCGTEPRKGSLGLGPDFRIIAPGDPDHSMLVVRMRELGSGRMPPIGSLQPDSAGIAVVSEWIRSLTGCQ